MNRDRTSSPVRAGLLTERDLPAPELQALALDGDVFRLDRAFCSIAEIDVPWRRARALADLFGDEFVAAGRSAAWVWGGLARAPLLHEALGTTHRGRHDIPVGLRVRAAAVADADLVDFGPVRVTTPLRTVVDLVRGESFDDDDARLVHFLATEHGVDRDAVARALDAVPRLPHKRRARRRLDAAGLGPAGLDPPPADGR